MHNLIGTQRSRAGDISNTLARNEPGEFPLEFAGRDAPKCVTPRTKGQHIEAVFSHETNRRKTWLTDLFLLSGHEAITRRIGSALWTLETHNQTEMHYAVHRLVAT